MSEHVHDGEWCAKCVEHGVVEQVKREARADVDGLVAALTEVAHGSLHFGWTAEEELDEMRDIAARALAGDKAEAPTSTREENL